mgnify:CR=1 FL=1
MLVPSSSVPEELWAGRKVLLNSARLDRPETYEPVKGTPTALRPLGALDLPREGLVDVEAERARLGKEIAKIEAALVTVGKKLTNENFVANAPAAVVAEHRQREADLAERNAQLKQMRDWLDA